MWADTEQQLSLFGSTGSDLQRPACEPQLDRRPARQITVTGVADAGQKLQHFKGTASGSDLQRPTCEPYQSTA